MGEDPLIRRYGRTAKLGDRSFVNAVITVLKTGTPWRDLPERLRQLEDHLQFATKIHALVDGQGRPIYVELTPGQQHEATVAESLIDHAQGRALIGDSSAAVALPRATRRAAATTQG